MQNQPSAALAALCDAQGFNNLNTAIKGRQARHSERRDPKVAFIEFHARCELDGAINFGLSLGDGPELQEFLAQLLFARFHPTHEWVKLAFGEDAAMLVPTQIVEILPERGVPRIKIFAREDSSGSHERTAVTICAPELTSWIGAVRNALPNAEFKRHCPTVAEEAFEPATA